MPRQIGDYRAPRPASAQHVTQPAPHVTRRAEPVQQHWAWADRMRRAFDIDVLACRRCGGRLRLIATVEAPEAIRAILAALAGSHEREGRAPSGGAGEAA